MANNDDQDFPNNGSENFRDFEASPDDAGLDTGAPAVASSSKKAMVGLVVFFAVLGLIVYFVLGGMGEEEAPPPQDDLTKALGDVAGEANGVAAPAAPPIVAPPVPVPPPPPAPEVSATPSPVDASVPPPPTIAAMAVNTPTDQAYQARIRSGMLVMSGSADPETPTASQVSTGPKSVDSNPNLAFAEKTYTSAAGGSTTAGRVEDLDRTIIEGKIINAVVESAINTDLPGKIRAVVSRDVYPESGRLVLIPKGSRIIGTYNHAFMFGQARIYIAWTRIIRPDGVDVLVNSPASDGLGRSGVEASYIDNKYLELLTAAALTTTITIGTAIAAENLVDDPTITETTNAEGDTTTQTSPAAEGVRDAVNNISETSKTAVDKFLKLAPTAYLDQGTPVNIMVNTDIVFPEEIIASNRYLE